MNVSALLYHMFIHVRIHIHVQVHSHVHMHIHILHIHVHVHVHVHIHNREIYTCRYVYLDIYIYTCIYICAYANPTCSMLWCLGHLHNTLPEPAFCKDALLASGGSDRRRK